MTTFTDDELDALLVHFHTPGGEPLTAVQENALTERHLNRLKEDPEHDPVECFCCCFTCPPEEEP